MGPSGHPENVLVKLKPLSLNGCLKARGCFSISQTGVSTLRKLEMAAIKVEGFFMAGIKNQEADLDVATDEGCPAGGNNPNKDEVTWGISVETAELLVFPTIFSTFVTPTHPTGLKVPFFVFICPCLSHKGASAARCQASGGSEGGSSSCSDVGVLFCMIDIFLLGMVAEGKGFHHVWVS